MKHLFINKNHPYTLIMLHGTGGNEEEMARFATSISSDLNILSIRGNINENGMFRYFKRFGMGLYDIENYIFETKNLNETITKLFKEYNLDLNKAIIVGFSNGANIALGLIQDYPQTINNYVLLSADYINKDKKFKKLDNLNVLISFSKNDPYANYDTIMNLQKELIKAGSNLTNHLVPGHIITEELLIDVRKFVEKIIKK